MPIIDIRAHGIGAGKYNTGSIVPMDKMILPYQFYPIALYSDRTQTYFYKGHGTDTIHRLDKYLNLLWSYKHPGPDGYGAGALYIYYISSSGYGYGVTDNRSTVSSYIFSINPSGSVTIPSAPYTSSSRFNFPRNYSFYNSTTYYLHTGSTYGSWYGVIKMSGTSVVWSTNNTDHVMIYQECGLFSNGYVFARSNSTYGTYYVINGSGATVYTRSGISHLNDSYKASASFFAKDYVWTIYNNTFYKYDPLTNTIQQVSIPSTHAYYGASYSDIVLIGPDNATGRVMLLKGSKIYSFDATLPTLNDILDSFKEELNFQKYSNSVGFTVSNYNALSWYNGGVLVTTTGKVSGYSGAKLL
jgi:hypothetical protein